MRGGRSKGHWERPTSMGISCVLFLRELLNSLHTREAELAKARPMAGYGRI